jgi:lipopolysaccharide export system permease protein
MQFDKNNVPTDVTYAEEAHADIQTQVWILYRGSHKILGKSLPSASVEFPEERITDMPPPDVLAASSKRATEMTNDELRKQIALQRSQHVNAGLFEVELRRRVSLPFACLVFALIGTPLGMRSHRRSSSIGVGLTLIIVFAYFIVSQWLGIIGEGGALDPITAVWLPNLFFALAGLILIATARK